MNDRKGAVLILGDAHQPVPERNKLELENIEVHLLLESMYLHYGWDFRNYSVASFKRRIWKCLREENLCNVSAFQEKGLRDLACMERFLVSVSIGVTSMFRDPPFHLALRKEVAGANQDGAQGLAVIKSRGGMTVVQDPATAESPAMPEAAIAATAVDKTSAFEGNRPLSGRPLWLSNQRSMKRRGGMNDKENMKTCTHFP